MDPGKGGWGFGLEGLFGVTGTPGKGNGRMRMAAWAAPCAAALPPSPRAFPAGAYPGQKFTFFIYGKRKLFL